MKNLTFSLLLIFCITCCFAQTNTDPGNPKNYFPHDYSKLPPSPEVASLMKYIEFPVSYCTGQPNINIPIYTLTEGDLTVPISISYHGGGIKVNEQAGLVGLGWTLIASGSISRTVYGLPDEMNTIPNTTYGLRGLFNLNSMDKSFRNIILNKYQDYEYNDPDNPFILDIGKKGMDYDDGKVDVANDVYNFNAQGISGTFIYDENKRLSVSTGNPVSLLSLGSPSGNYLIKDNMSAEYLFSETEMSKFEYQYNNGSGYLKDSINYISAWHLTKIKNIYNDVVMFNYSNAQFKRIYTGGYYSYANSTNPILQPNQLTIAGNTLQYYPKSLTSIVGKTTTVRFHYDTQYNTLQSITVHRNDKDETKIKEFVFIHSYIRMGTNDKLMLDEIREVTPSGYISLYKFDYIRGNTMSNGYYNSQDHWGYYNGKYNGTLLVRNIYSHTGFTGGYDIADREPDESSTKIGILKSISYPTGGSTTFDWEQNDYSFIQNRNIPTYDRVDTITRFDKLIGIKRDRNGVNVERLESSYITVGNNIEVTVDLSKYVSGLVAGGTAFVNWKEYSNVYHYNSDNCPKVQLFEIKPNGFHVLTRIFYFDEYYSEFDASGNQLSSYNKSPLKYFGGGGSSGKFYLKLINPRNFDGVPLQNINGYFDGGSEASAEAQGYVSIKIVTKVTTKDTPIKPWGGLRIAKISSVPNSGLINPIIKKYKYRQNSYTNVLSTGHVYMEPTYNYKNSQSVYTSAGSSRFQIERIDRYCVSSGGLYSTTAGGGNVEYSSVNEIYEGDGLENMAITYGYGSDNYEWDQMDAICQETIPGGARMLTSYSHTRNILSRRDYSNSEGNVYKSVSYKYDLSSATSPVFSGPFSMIIDFSRLNYKGLSIDYTACKYRLVSYNNRIQNEYTWESRGKYEKYDTVTYAYFYPGYSASPLKSLVKSKSYISSKGDLVTTYYSYAKVNGVLVDLKETEVTVVNNRITSARRWVYNSDNHRIREIFSISPGTPVENSFKLGNDYWAEQPLLDAINIPEYSYAYDNLGNLKQINFNGEALASYLWGYKGTYPILEAKNITAEELAGKLRETSNNSPEILADITDSESIKNILEQMRAKFPDKDITTMTYHWLIGVSTATDSRGITTHFTFDDFGRLSDVKDYNGYFIRKYDYHYAVPK